MCVYLRLFAEFGTLLAAKLALGLLDNIFSLNLGEPFYDVVKLSLAQGGLRQLFHQVKLAQRPVELHQQSVSGNPHIFFGVAVALGRQGHLRA